MILPSFLMICILFFRITTRILKDSQFFSGIRRILLESGEFFRNAALHLLPNILIAPKNVNIRLVNRYPRDNAVVNQASHVNALLFLQINAPNLFIFPSVSLPS